MIEVRTSNKDDFKYISQIFKENTDREPSENLSAYVSQYPSVVAVDNEKIVGFCYSKPFAPDILELMNIFIIASHRGKGNGKKLIKEFELLAFNKFAFIILVNSNLYPTKEVKRLATNFYIGRGYKEIISTSNSKVYAKNGMSK